MTSERERFGRAARCVLAAIVSVGGGCTSSGAGADDPDGASCLGGTCDADLPDGGDADGDGDGASNAAACELLCGALCCEAGQVCVNDLCIEEVSCAGGEPCQSDAYCDDGLCVPFGPPFQDFDPTCLAEIRRGFEPVVQCEWPGDFEIETPTSISVGIPPLVADLAADGITEIIFTSCRGLDHATGRIRAIRGDTCEPVWTSDHSVALQEPLAAADLDGDGAPEVCGRDAGGVPFCLDGEGELLWEGHDAHGAPVAVGPGYWVVGLSVANVDGAGPPEVVAGLMAFDGETGQLLRGRQPPGSLWEEPALADVDGDGHVEVLTGGWIYDLVTDEVVDWGTSHGSVAVAELSAAHEGPEVVVVSWPSGVVRVHALDGEVIFQHAVPGDSGGPPAVADLDGDGQAELAAAGNRFLTAFDLDCAGITGATCPEGGTAEGVMWSQPSHELSSGFTGSAVFDFEGDGPVEVVYADECWARVYDGATGEVRFSTPHSSGTSMEYPVIADVDGDFSTEIVVPHFYYFPITSRCPEEDPLMPGVVREPGRLYDGITVYRDRLDRWAPSRPLWSQHTEHYSQRDDEGGVPVVERPSWASHNSYRQALLSEHPDSRLWIPDLTVGGLEASEECVADGDPAVQHLRARVCNRGTLGAAAGVTVAFYLDSADGEPTCTAATDRALEPGECDDVDCEASVPLNVSYEIVAVVDPPEAGASALGECHEDNNGASFDDVCPRPD